MGKCRCRFPEGITVKPNGVNRLDPCVYADREIHRNVTVTVSQCTVCGHVSISWNRQEDTEDEIIEQMEDEPDDD